MPALAGLSGDRVALPIAKVVPPGFLHVIPTDDA
jgi:hypothetical protein